MTVAEVGQPCIKAAFGFIAGGNPALIGLIPGVDPQDETLTPLAPVSCEMEIAQAAQHEICTWLSIPGCLCLLNSNYCG